MLRQCGGTANAYAGLRRQCLLYFLPVAVIFHLGSVITVVIQHCAIRCDPCHTNLSFFQVLEIVHAVLFCALHDKGRHGLHLIQLHLFEVLVQHTGNQQKAEQQHGDNHGNGRLEDLLGHTLPSPSR